MDVCAQNCLAKLYSWSGSITEKSEKTNKERTSHHNKKGKHRALDTGMESEKYGKIWSVYERWVRAWAMCPGCGELVKCGRIAGFGSFMVHRQIPITTTWSRSGSGSQNYWDSLPR